MLMWKCARSRFCALIVGAVGAIGLLSWAAPVIAGQGAANPSGIAGVVTDNSGAVLPGVTITATSPALQVPSVTDVTNERGEYRLSPLPIGVYTVLFELPGFQNVRREGVRLTVAFTARVDTEMNVGAVSETITVWASCHWWIPRRRRLRPSSRGNSWKCCRPRAMGSIPS
jgi:hypothetical protein